MLFWSPAWRLQEINNIKLIKVIGTFFSLIEFGLARGNLHTDIPPGRPGGIFVGYVYNNGNLKFTKTDLVTLVREGNSWKVSSSVDSYN